MFARLVQTAVTVGCACKRGATDRSIVPATDATAPNFVVFGEETDVAAARTKAAGVMADVCYLEDEREVPVVIAGNVTEGDCLAPTAGGQFITTTTGGDYYACIATRSGVAGDVIPALAIPGRIR